jgi:hypothetical protein
MRKSEIDVLFLSNTKCFLCQNFIPLYQLEHYKSIYIYN